MVSFENDYNKGAHPEVLEALCRTNGIGCTGYGNDPYCASAIEKIRMACACPQAQIFFLTGGTQTNAVIISSMLREYEGVIAATTGHVSLHEAGAIEGTGHKVIELEQTDGKLSAETVSAYLRSFYNDGNHEHMVYPGMVYISYPTEVGTLYSKEELTALHTVCKSYGIPLFMDGARLGYGLASPECDMALPDIAALTDVFSIGGTKVGTLIGEAAVFTKKNMPDHFVTTVKRHGALLAKGRVLGVQFDALFTDNLYQRIGAHAMEMAQRLVGILKAAGCTFYMDSPTNQQFILMENDKMQKLSESVAFSFWEKVDDTHTAIRFVTSWGTTEEELQILADSLAALNG